MSRGRGSRGKRTTHIVAVATEILREIQPCSVRAVCYQLQTRGLIPNMRKSATNSISRLLRIAREDGVIPWAWIVDESRDAETAYIWDNAKQFLPTCINQYRRDYWQDQHYRVEVWSEKGTVRGTLGPVLDEYGITFRVMHGYASATVVNDIADLAASSDKPLVIFYCGDWDPSGKHMSDVDLPKRLEAYSKGGELKLRRVALEREDLRGLPSFDPQTKQSDPRYRWFQRNVRTRCYELDAMSPPILRARVEANILACIDKGKWEQARCVERAEVESMRVFYKSWQATINGGAR